MAPFRNQSARARPPLGDLRERVSCVGEFHGGPDPSRPSLCRIAKARGGQTDTFDVYGFSIRGRGLGLIELGDFFVHISRIVVGGEPWALAWVFCHPPILGFLFPRGATFASLIVAFIGGRNWSIFWGLDGGQSLTKCEP